MGGIHCRDGRSTGIRAMAVVSVPEFKQNIQYVCSNSGMVMRIQIISETRRQVRIRIFLVNRTFLDTYYNQKTGKAALTHIQKNERILGADNTGGAWHWHPYEDPQRHDRSDNQITFEEFLKRVEEIIK